MEIHLGKYTTLRNSPLALATFIECVEDAYSAPMRRFLNTEIKQPTLQISDPINRRNQL